MLVHREALARPINGRALAPQLLGDARAVLLFPLPDARDEPLASEVMARQPLFFEFALDDDLRRNARMVRPRQPQCAVTAHAMVAREHIHQRMLKGMAHVERARHVGRRNDDREDGRLGIAVLLRSETPLRLPTLIVLRFG